MLEFIDWGGATYSITPQQPHAPGDGIGQVQIAANCRKNMSEGKIVLSAGAGFLDYTSMDVDAYRRQCLRSFVAMLYHLGVAPRIA